MNLWEICCKDVKLYELTRDTKRWQAFVEMVMNFQVALTTCISFNNWITIERSGNASETVIYVIKMSFKLERDENRNSNILFLESFVL
jgi:hypothetical protein